jgi:hypothetical protein
MVELCRLSQRLTKEQSANTKAKCHLHGASINGKPMPDDLIFDRAALLTTLAHAASAPGRGSPPPTSAPGLGPPPPTPAPGLGSPLHICTGTGVHLSHLCACPCRSLYCSSAAGSREAYAFRTLSHSRMSCSVFHRMAERCSLSSIEALSSHLSRNRTRQL